MSSFMPGEFDWMEAWGKDPFGRVAGIPQAAPQGGGLFGNVMDKFNDPRMQLGLAILANSGRSEQKKGLGEILGTSMMQVQQGRRAQDDAALRRQYMQAQIGRMQQPERAAIPSSIQEYEYAKANGFQGSFEDWKRSAIERQDVGPPASVREWDHFNKLSPQDQARYLQMKRALQIETIQQVPTVIGPGGAQQPLSSLPAETGAAAAMAGAKKAGEVQGGAQAQARVDLPSAEINADQTLALLDDLENHPGLSRAVGKSAVIPVIPGTNAADFVSRLEQLQGKQFLEAYQSLRGGGQITEVEGKKAEAAIARIQNRRVSEKDYKQAIKDLREVVKKGIDRQRQKAGLAPVGSVDDLLKKYAPE